VPLRGVKESRDNDRRTLRNWRSVAKHPATASG